MPYSVDLSDDFFEEARQMAKQSDRSVGDQIEFWAYLGQSIEPLWRGDSAETLRQTGKSRSLSEALRTVSTEEGRRRVQNYLQSRPFPRFEAVPGSPELVRKVEADGRVTVGKFVNRVFEPVEP